MAVQRDFAIIQGSDLWRRAAFMDTALEADGTVVRLAFEALRDAIPEAIPDASPDATPALAAPLPPRLGLAFDPGCRLYIALPRRGRLLRVNLANGGDPQPVELIGEHPRQAGEFTLAGDPRQGLTDPTALAIDGEGRLFVAEGRARRIRIFDLVDRRPLRTVLLDEPPIALATTSPGTPANTPANTGDTVWLLLAGGERIGRLNAYRDPVFEPLPVAAHGAQAMTLDDRGQPLLLVRRGRADAAIIPLHHPDQPLSVPGASDLAWTGAGDGEQRLVVARGPGQAMRRFRLTDSDRFEEPGLSAHRYRGDGIVVDHRGRVGFWTEQGFSRASHGRRRFRPQGRVTGFALDSGQFQTHWGRLFVDACIPKGSSLRVHCLTLDEHLPAGTSPLPRTPPANALTLTVNHPHLSPAMPPRQRVEGVEPAQTLHQRGNGNEFPWNCPPPDERFETYEAPVIAPPGRYLWVVLALSGGARITPRVRGLRVEYPGHDWMQRLPRIYSADPNPAEFMQRYLAILEGDYHDLELRAAARHMLLDPDTAPAEALPWLAGFLGLALDRRWPEAARRTLIAEANWLFRFRGTVPGLRRMLAIYLGRPPQIIEHFKVRGLGGAILGNDDALSANSILGAGFRVGGVLAEDSGDTVSVNQQTLEEVQDNHAHRFTVVLPIILDQAQRGVVEQILAVHRPAHTLYDICSLDTGMRMGIALYSGLTALIGRGSGFGALRLGGSALGRNDLIRGGNSAATTSTGPVGDLRMGPTVSEAPATRDCKQADHMREGWSGGDG